MTACKETRQWKHGETVMVDETNHEAISNKNWYQKLRGLPLTVKHAMTTSDGYIRYILYSPNKSTVCIAQRFLKSAPQNCIQWNVGDIVTHPQVKGMLRITSLSLSAQSVCFEDAWTGADIQGCYPLWKCRKAKHKPQSTDSKLIMSNVNPDFGDGTTLNTPTIGETTVFDLDEGHRDNCTTPAEMLNRFKLTTQQEEVIMFKVTRPNPCINDESVDRIDRDTFIKCVQNEQQRIAKLEESNKDVKSKAITQEIEEARAALTEAVQVFDEYHCK